VTVSPGRNAVTTLVGVCGASFPHGPVFCGVPSALWTIQLPGAIKWK
jgi:hypothetical protein